MQIFKVIAAVTLLLPPIFAQAQDVERILEAEDAGHYLDAMDMLSVLAEQGDAWAQNKLGSMYQNGHDDPMGYPSEHGHWSSGVEALRWYRAAAEQGNAEAQANLAFMFETGRATEQDFDEAAHWFQKAAEQGDVRAQANLGFMFENGRGVQQSDIDAAKWFGMAAHQGDTYSRSSLRSMAENGRVNLQEQTDADTVQPINWSGVDVGVTSELKKTMSDNTLFQAAEELPEGYLWQDLGANCSFSLREREIIQSLVDLRADVIPVTYSGYYGTHSHLKERFDEHALEAAYHLLFDRPDLVERYKPAASAFNFYRQQIDDIPNRDTVLAEMADLFETSRTSVDQLDENGQRSSNVSIALSKFNLEPYPNACLKTRSGYYAASLEDWIISFWVRRSVEGNYDFAKQVMLALSNVKTGATSD